MDQALSMRLPWTTDIDAFRADAETTPDGACILFSIEASIPREARGGYATLVMAYARESEPVTVLEDGSALLLIRDGGSDAGRSAAARIFDQVDKLGLRKTLRAGVVPTIGTGEEILDAVRETAAASSPGEVRTAS